MPELYPEDQERVNRYLAADIHRVERKPFRPLLLLTAIMVTLGLLTLIAVLIGRSHGVI